MRGRRFDCRPWSRRPPRDRPVSAAQFRVSLWRFGFLESGAPEALFGQNGEFGPGSIAVGFCACRSRFPRTALGLRLAPADQLLEVFDLFGIQIPPHPRWQSAQGEVSDLHPPQFFHQPVKVREHDADLVLAALRQAHLIPGVFRFPNQLDFRRSRALATQRNAGFKRCELFFAEMSVRFDDVDLLHVACRRRDAVGELAIVGQEQ
jgi:hypothetical protein